MADRARRIRELHMIGTQLKRIADAMAVPVVESSPFVEPPVLTGLTWSPFVKLLSEFHASPGCACGTNMAGESYIDPICRPGFERAAEILVRRGKATRTEND